MTIVHHDAARVVGTFIHWVGRTAVSLTMEVHPTGKKTDNDSNEISTE